MRMLFITLESIQRILTFQFSLTLKSILVKEINSVEKKLSFSLVGSLILSF